jgi:hypothetical protein
MSQFVQIKKPAFIIKSALRALTLLVLCSVYLGSLQLSHAAVRRSSDEVFCPLQKMWVKKNPAAPSPGNREEPLKDICARVERKDIFLFELTESLRFTRATPSGRETEKLFFTYLAKGKPSLTRYFYSQNAPEPEFLSAAQSGKSANNNFRADIAAAPESRAAAKLPHLFPAPFVNNFSPQTVVELKNISRHISPRAPPAHV